MLILLFFIIFLIIYKCKVGNNENYLSIEQTTSINGIFIILVFIRHISQYVTFNNLIDMPVTILDKITGQLIVTMFLFNSGFGIMESIKNKNNYVDQIPRKRILKTWFEFSICVLLYYLTNIILGTKISILNLLLSIFCIDSIGNSNWYILTMLMLWIFTYLSFKYVKKTFKYKLFAMTILIILYILILVVTGRPSYYYNTIVCYLYGIIYSQYYEKIKNKYKNIKKWILAFIINLTLLSFCAILIYKSVNNLIIYEIMSLFFVNCILLIMKKIEFKNKISYFLGKNLFGLYMIQRLPMIVLKKFGVDNFNIYVYTYLCFILMIILGCFYNQLMKKLNKRIYIGGENV